MGVYVCHVMFGRLCGDALTALDVPISVAPAPRLVTTSRHTTKLNAGLAVSLSPHGSVKQT